MADTPQYREISDSNLSAEQFNHILCPNLRIGVRMSMLNPDKDGWVSSDEMERFLTYIGAKENSLVLNQLISISEGTTEIKKDNHINIVALKGTALDHGSSSGILNNPEGFSEERLTFLKSFSEDEKCLYKKDIAGAANDFHRCPVNFKSKLGTNVQTIELATVMDIYGKKDVNGDAFFKLEDVDAIWKDNRFPTGWYAPKKTFYGTLRAAGRFLRLSIARLMVKLFHKKRDKAVGSAHTN